MKKFGMEYITPQTIALEIATEGPLCESGSSIEDWGTGNNYSFE